MIHLTKITKIFSLSLLMILLICGGCGSDSKNATTETPIPVPANAVVAEVTPPPTIAEANLAAPEVTEITTKEVKTAVVEPIKVEPKVAPKEEKPKKTERKRRAKMVFDQPTHNYGFIMEGDKVEHDFHFKNIGDDDLLITRVKASCGCTTPKYPTEVIPPGGSGKVSVVFNSKGKLGRQIPKVDVYTNYQRRLTVKLEGIVDTERSKPPTVVKEKVDQAKEKIEDIKEVIKDNVIPDTSSVGGI